MSEESVCSLAVSNRLELTESFSFRCFSVPSYDDVDVITAYEQNLPTKAFSQDGAGQEHSMGPNAEHTKLEVSFASSLSLLTSHKIGPRSLMIALSTSPSQTCSTGTIKESLS